MQREWIVTKIVAELLHTQQKDNLFIFNLVASDGKVGSLSAPGVVLVCVPK